MNPATGAKVSLEGVERKFDAPVVARFDLSIRPGEFVSLLGPSGCGKSTLLRLIADLDRPDGGRVVIDSFGRKFFRAFVFQEAALLPWRTALGNVMMPLELMGRGRVAAKADAERALAKVGLMDAFEKFPSQLSGGMKMRVSVARALVVEPSLLLLDEPFAALDENTRYRLQEDLRSLWLATRMTTIFVTHSVQEAVYLSDRAVLLSPRPARISLDHHIDLPEVRPASLRTDARFIREVETISRSYRDTDQNSSNIT
ncbi:MAG: ABC transporter ATP-binding protein [Bdellovibrionota bacterium]